MNSIRSFGVVLFVLFGVVLSAQDHKRAPPMQVVLDHIAAAPAIYGDSVIERFDRLKRPFQNMTGTVVTWTNGGSPSMTRSYENGEASGTWYELDSAGVILIVDSFPSPGAPATRYRYGYHGGIEMIAPWEFAQFDRIFGGNTTNGIYLFFYPNGQQLREYLLHDDQTMITGYYSNGSIAFKMTRSDQTQEEEYWCTHGRRVGSIIIDCISGECRVLGTQYEWSPELSSYYKIRYGKKRYTLQRMNDGTKVTFSNRDELEAAVRDLSLISLFWRDEIEFEPLPCRHKQ